MPYKCTMKQMKDYVSKLQNELDSIHADTEKEIKNIECEYMQYKKKYEEMRSGMIFSVIASIVFFIIFVSTLVITRS